MQTLAQPFRRRIAEEQTQNNSVGERIKTIGICVRLLRLMLGFVFDAGFRRMVPGATFSSTALARLALKVRGQMERASRDSKMQTFL
jgi:hypothetical protein